MPKGRRFRPELRAEAVRLHRIGGRSLRAPAEELGIGPRRESVYDTAVRVYPADILSTDESHVVVDGSARLCERCSLGAGDRELKRRR